jgi:hypothetical protein
MTLAEMLFLIAGGTGILIQNKTIEKWNGILPQVTGGSMPLLDLNSFKGAKQ